MKIIPVKTPNFVKTLFPNFTWNIDTPHKELYLTFDDGPTPEITNWVLSILKEYNAKATFFCIGNNIEKHPLIFQKVIKQGHAVGNHTYNHLKGWKSKTEEYIEDIKKTQLLINASKPHITYNDLESENLKLFRPPYGKFKVKQSKHIQKLGYKIVLWDVLPFDWDESVSEEICLENITSTAKEGSVVVLHDSVKASRNLKYVLPKILDYYSKKGFTFKAITSNLL